jgi:hypothetical protein
MPRTKRRFCGEKLRSQKRKVIRTAICTKRAIKRCDLHGVSNYELTIRKWRARHLVCSKLIGCWKKLIGLDMKTIKPLSLRRILVPIDFSKNARRALHYAIPFHLQ